MKRACGIGVGGGGDGKEKNSTRVWLEQPKKDNFEDVGIDGKIVSK
jgi:hypothetical protein